MNTVLTTIAEPIIFLFDNHDITQALDSNGKNIILRYAPTPDGQPFIFNYRNLSYNTVFLLALIMAVPNVRPRLRIRILILGLLLLFPIQIFRIVIVVFNYYGQHMQMDGNAFYSDIPRKGLLYTERTMARLDGQVIPVLIWAGLYFYYKWARQYFKRTE